MPVTKVMRSVFPLGKMRVNELTRDLTMWTPLSTKRATLPKGALLKPAHTRRQGLIWVAPRAPGRLALSAKRPG